MVADALAGGNAGPPVVVGPVSLAAVARWLRSLVWPDQVVELRAIRRDRGVAAGYFDGDHLDDMARTAVELSDSGVYKGVYFTPNPVNPALLARSPNRISTGVGVSKDGDVVRRR